MKSTYAGVCYDGPCEGQHRECPTRYFYVAAWEGLPGNIEQYTMNQSIRNHTYRWSFPLRKWVFES